MTKFYSQYEQYILSVVILIASVSSFAFPADGFARSFLLGLSAGTAIVLVGTVFKRSNSKEKKVDNAA
jgi:hypothetical protein